MVYIIFPGAGKDIGGSEYEGTILNIPFLPKNLENFSVGTAEEFEITEE